MEDRSKTQNKEMQVVVFRLGKEEFGVGIDQIKEINRLTEITHLPKAPSFVEGIINLRGQVVMVIDLSKRLDLPVVEYDDRARIIIVETGKTSMGLIVDSVSEALRFSMEQFEETTNFVNSQVNTQFLRGVAKLSDKRLLLILDLLKVLSRQEISELEAVSQGSSPEIPDALQSE